MPSSDHDWERVATIGIAAGLLGVVAVMSSLVLISLSDANIASLGGWLERHGSDIWKAVAGAAAAVATFLFGHRRGRSMGLDEAEIADAAAARGHGTGNDAAAEIERKREKRVHRRR